MTMKKYGAETKKKLNIKVKLAKKYKYANIVVTVLSWKHQTIII